MNLIGTLTRPGRRTAAAFSLLVALLVAATACGNDTEPASAPKTEKPVVLTFELIEDDSEFEMFDVGEKGDSVGDRNTSAATLEIDGRVAGRMQGVCTTLDNAYEGHLCDLALIIEGGSLTLASGGVRTSIPNVDGRGDVFAVTGGTGKYRDAAGDVVVSEDGQTITVNLVSS